MPWGCAVYSIRMIFSIADIEDGAQEDYENPESEAEQGAEDEPINSYPIRTSVSITKVRCPVILDFLGVGLIFFSSLHRRQALGASTSTWCARTGTSSWRTCRSTRMPVSEQI